MSPFNPSASTTTPGLFQKKPSLPPQYTFPNPDKPNGTTSLTASDDKPLARLLSLYLPAHHAQISQHVHALARLVLNPQILAHDLESETSRPFLRHLTTFGEEEPSEPVWTGAGWRALKEIAAREGVVGVVHEGSSERVNRRVYGSALRHVWGGGGGGTPGVLGMTDAVAAMLKGHLAQADGGQIGRLRVLEEAYRRLVGRDPGYAWTSAVWVAERQGGGIAETETVASRLSERKIEEDVAMGRDCDAVGMPLGPWVIDGHKLFSSAVDSEMSVLLARTAQGGLSAFYVPMRRRSGRNSSAANIIHNIVNEGPPPTELNGIRIKRLENKLGTRSLPTAEIQIKGARGWLIGTEGQGIEEISAVLDITRLSTATGGVSNWSRGLAICRAYSKVRKVRGELLQDNPAHLRWMSDETVKYWANAHFAFLGAALQGALEQDWNLMAEPTKARALVPRDKAEARALLSLLLPAMKAQVSVSSVDGLRQCMECLGGVGYCENNKDGGPMNIAKIYRDNLANPIWWGTVSAMAEDVVRVLTDQRHGNGNVLETIFMVWIDSILNGCTGRLGDEIAVVRGRMQQLLRLVNGARKEELLYRGRDILEHIHACVPAALLLHDATVSPDYVAHHVAKRWVRSITKAPAEVVMTLDWREEVEIDRCIFLGGPPIQQISAMKL